MFSHHVSKKLSAYCNDELSTDESRQIGEHLLGCPRCRMDYEEIKLGVKLAERLPLVSAPDSLWEELQSKEIGVEPVPHKSRFRVWYPRVAAVAAVLIVAVLFGGYWFQSRESRPFWEVARLDGAPRIGNSTIARKGQLAVGEWLETDGNSRAKIDVGTIGHVEVDPNTRVRLVETKLTEHRLELAKGKMSARIWAPPRLFFVDTPSAVAADMGCAYTLEVKDDGSGILHVTSGWVALQLKDRESMVPAGAACATRPGIGPGTPYYEDASQIFREALTKFDFEPQDTTWSQIPTLDLLLREARPRDSLTLWHLLSRVNGRDRERVYERLAGYVPPPEGVTREGVLSLDVKMLNLWRDKLTTTGTFDEKLKKVWSSAWDKVLDKATGQEGKK